MSRVGAVDDVVEPPRWRWSSVAVARVASNGLGLRRAGCDRPFTVPVLGCFRSCPESDELEAGSTWTWADVEGSDRSPRLAECVQATPVASACQVARRLRVNAFVETTCRSRPRVGMSCLLTCPCRFVTSLGGSSRLDLPCHTRHPTSTFRLVGQAYRGAAPGFIAVSSRRRDGSTRDGGYEHGEFKFTGRTLAGTASLSDDRSSYTVSGGWRFTPPSLERPVLRASACCVRHEGTGTVRHLRSAQSHDSRSLRVYVQPPTRSRACSQA